MRGIPRGSALAEVIVSLLVLTPILVGIPLLGKQLDVKHKSIDAARYTVWERTVWRSSGNTNRKAAEDITLEARDRALGHPESALLAPDELRSSGVSENPLWRDRRGRRLLNHEAAGAAPVGIDQRMDREPVKVGYLFVPSLAHGDGAVAGAASILDVDDLGLNARAFASVSVRIGLRPLLQQNAASPVSLAGSGHSTEPMPTLTQHASGAILSDSWSSRDEVEFGRRVDSLTVDEMIEKLELPSRVLALNALGKGKPLFGEGQFAWDANLRPSSVTLPRAYVEKKQ